MKNNIQKTTASITAAVVVAVSFSTAVLNTLQVNAQPVGSFSQFAQTKDQEEVLDVNTRLNGDSAGTDVDCGGVKIAFDVGCRDDFSNPILAYLVAILRFLTYGVGVVVTMMIIIGGIQYSAAGGNAQAVGAAKARILNAVIALILYIFAFAILNFVVPGGLIG